MDELPEKRHGLRGWIAAAFLLPVLYVASFGLACRIAAVPEHDLDEPNWTDPPAWLYAYQPIGWTSYKYSRAKDAVQWFAGYFIPYGSGVLIPVDREGATAFFYKEWEHENGIDQWKQLIHSQG